MDEDLEDGYTIACSCGNDSFVAGDRGLPKCSTCESPFPVTMSGGGICLIDGAWTIDYQ